MLQLSTKVVVLLLYLLLLCVLIHGMLSNVYSQQEARGENDASNRKGIWNDIDFETGTKRFGLGGRKLGSFGSLMKGHGPCERPSKVASKTKRKQSTRNLLSKEKELAGFVAFNADYKGPRHHPPKNN